MLEAKRAPELVDRELARMAAVAKERIETMRTSWPWAPEAGRAFMETLLDGRLTVTPTADGRFKLAGRIVVSDCEPIDAEEGRPARLGTNRGLAKALETIEAEDSGITLRTKCVIPGRPRRDSNGFRTVLEPLIAAVIMQIAA